MLLTLIDGALRAEELISARKDDLATDGTLVVQGKGAKTRQVALSEATVAAIDSYLARRSGGSVYLFQSDGGSGLGYESQGGPKLLHQAHEIGVLPTFNHLAVFPASDIYALDRHPLSGARNAHYLA